MTKPAFEMQVVRLTESCGGSPVKVGESIIVVTDNLAQAKCMAAVERLKMRHDTTGMYHAWLVAQASGRKFDLGPYDWAHKPLEIG